MPNTIGLSNVLLNDLPWRETLLRPPGIPDLDILPAGSVSRRAADLVGAGLQRLLDECSGHYDLIILENVGAEDIPEPTQRLLAAAVRDMGLGLIMVGGTNSFGAGGWRNTPLEPILPVILDLPERLVEPEAPEAAVS